MRSIMLIVLLGCSSTASRPQGDDTQDGPVDARAADAAHDGPADAATAIDAPPGVAENCTAYPFKKETLYAERVGFGRNATGGSWSQPYHVTTLADTGAGSLRAGLESTQPYWIVFNVNGTITLQSALRPKSNKTLDGRGRNITIDGEIKIEPGTKNLIFTDVKLQFPSGWQAQTGDIISIRGHGSDDPEDYDSRDMWFHHLELGRGGDGQLDNRGATYVTVSWSHMHSHAKAFLHTNDTDSGPSRGNRTTYHHNFFDRVSRRGPQFHWGMADFFNNYQYQWYEYGAASQREAQFLSENNIYEARPGQFCLSCPDPNNPAGDSDYEVSKVGLTSSWDAPAGYIRSVGDVAREVAIVSSNEPTMVFQRSTYYTAVVDPVNDALIQTLKTKTGPRRTYCQ